MSNVVMMSADRERQGPGQGRLDLARVISLSPTAMTYWNHDLECVYANEACRDWLNLDPEIMVGCRFESVLDVLRLPEHFALANAVLQGEPRTLVQPFHEGAARREGLVQFIPDKRGHLVRGFLLQVGPLPLAPRFPRAAR